MNELPNDRCRNISDCTLVKGDCLRVGFCLKRHSAASTPKADSGNLTSAADQTVPARITGPEVQELLRDPCSAVGDYWARVAERFNQRFGAVNLALREPAGAQPPNEKEHRAAPSELDDEWDEFAEHIKAAPSLEAMAEVMRLKLDELCGRAGYASGAAPSEAPSLTDVDGEPITPQRLIAWLEAKYARHGEEEDKWAADYIRAAALGVQPSEAPSWSVMDRVLTVENVRALVGALRTQRQIDEDGSEVGVSREAVDFAAALIERHVLAALGVQEVPRG